MISRTNGLVSPSFGAFGEVIYLVFNRATGPIGTVIEYSHPLGTICSGAGSDMGGGRVVFPNRARAIERTRQRSGLRERRRFSPRDTNPKEVLTTEFVHRVAKDHHRGLKRPVARDCQWRHVSRQQ